MKDGPYTNPPPRWLHRAAVAVVGAVVIGANLWERRDLWPYGALGWLLLMVLAAWVDRFTRAINGKLLSTGTFTTARVVERRVRLDAEDSELIISFEVAAAPSSVTYRDGPSGPRHIYRCTLNHRWFVRDSEAPFENGAEFPLLHDDDDRAGLVFVHDEVIDVTRVANASASYGV
jgi:hypothetical protein